MSEKDRVRAEIEFAEFVDAACPEAGGRTARQAYNGQKAELFALLRRLAGADLLDTDDSEAAACLLHNLAGTAAYFGEFELGGVSAELEFPMRHAVDPATLHRDCNRLLTLLKAA